MMCAVCYYFPHYRFLTENNACDLHRCDSLRGFPLHVSFSSALLSVLFIYIYFFPQPQVSRIWGFLAVLAAALTRAKRGTLPLCCSVSIGAA